MEQFRFTCHIEKSTKGQPDERRFFGRGYIHDKDGQQITDHSGDTIDTSDAQRALEEAFYDYVKSSRSGDLEHEHFDASTLIEGFVVTKEKKAAGIFPAEMDEGYYVGYEANDTPAGDVLWEGVKSGRLQQLSIVGEGWREG